MQALGLRLGCGCCIVRLLERLRGVFAFVSSSVLVDARPALFLTLANSDDSAVAGQSEIPGACPTK